MARLAILWIWCGLAPATSAGAATFVVTKETDDDGLCEIGDCALREAVLAANAAPGPDSIVLPGGTYQLSIPGPAEGSSFTGDLDVLEDLELLGDPGTPTIIVGDGGDRVLEIRRSAVLISNLTITGGSVGSSGGGVRTVLSDVTIVDSTIRDNSTTQDGGGIFFQLGTLDLINTTVSGNSAGPFGLGGGIFTFGIVQINPTTLTVVNSTFSGNSARRGGGIYSSSASHVFITNSTLAANTATFGGDAFANNASPAPTFANTLFTGGCSIFSNLHVSLGGNIESPGNTCQLPDTDRHSIADPGIAGLADNSGPTWTHALLPGSPAIDTAVDGQCPDTDQRGFERPFDGDEDMVATCDVGAYELHEPNLTPLEIPALSSVGWAAFVLILAAAAVLRIRRQSRA
ncbi:MAG: right-handed parallel beta-helix repeat-containing protein [Thermoanaerobaculia bacterium]